MGAVHNMYQNQQNNVILIKYFFFHHISTRAKFLVLSFHNNYSEHLPLYQEKTRVYIIYMFRPAERTSFMIAFLDLSFDFLVNFR